VSVLTGIPVRRDVAMTGEITLRGEVLPIGGLKEKLLAAHRGGIKTVLIPKENEKDLAEIPDNVKDKLDIKSGALDRRGARVRAGAARAVAGGFGRRGPLGKAAGDKRIRRAAPCRKAGAGALVHLDYAPSPGGPKLTPGDPERVLYSLGA
jgi:hypothetical protein